MTTAAAELSLNVSAALLHPSGIAPSWTEQGTGGDGHWAEQGTGGNDRWTDEGTGTVTAEPYSCPSDPPTPWHLLHVPGWYCALLACYALCVLVSLSVYIDEVCFILRHFRRGGARAKKTIWILAYFPSFTVTAFLSVILPKSSTLCDLVSNLFFATCLYQFLGLMTDYLGGRKRLDELLAQTRHIRIATRPLCCLCSCLPTVLLNELTYRRLAGLVTQMTVLRPLLLFVAAVLWTNDAYSPGNLDPRDGFPYIALLNVASTMAAVWGLNVLREAFRPELEPIYRLRGKISCLQLSMVTSALPNLVLGSLVKSDVIGCTSVYSAKILGDIISHGVVVVVMCLYGLLARHFFRQPSDATSDLAGGPDGAREGVKNGVGGEGCTLMHQETPDPHICIVVA